MSYQADMKKRYEMAEDLGVDLSEVDELIDMDDDWFTEDSTTALIDALIERIEALTNKPT